MEFNPSVPVWALSSIIKFNVSFDSVGSDDRFLQTTQVGDCGCHLKPHQRNADGQDVPAVSVQREPRAHRNRSEPASPAGAKLREFPARRRRSPAAGLRAVLPDDRNAVGVCRSGKRFGGSDAFVHCR
uniref:(northern house mosquito) hypothetical protein n=1 Tax=Culex pipiens TaxID=7175 RepID=A0A8D8JA68_CULPI